MAKGESVENGNISSLDTSNSVSSLLFLGTGCSSAVPNVMCLLQPSDPACQVCFQSLSLPPDKNPNYRGNTSLLIDYSCGNGVHNYILIDVGKTFREQVLRWFIHHKIPRVDSIILTHEHADAVLGLDDIRAVQPYSPTNDIDPTPIHLTQFAMDSIAQKFPYLVQKKLKEGQEVRRVAQLEWKIIESNLGKPFITSGLQFIPLPVMHGEDYISLGFLFGDKSRVAYISDVSRIPPSTEYVISKTGAGQLDLLILDTLYKKGQHNTHFCLPQTLEAVKRICPKQALFIGMTHEFDHHKDNEELAEWSRRSKSSYKRKRKPVFITQAATEILNSSMAPSAARRKLIVYGALEGRSSSNYYGNHRVVYPLGSQFIGLPTSPRRHHVNSFVYEDIN